MRATVDVGAWAAVLALAGGCGRIGYDAGPDGAVAIDAVDAVDAPDGLIPLHQYRFAGDFADDQGGPALAPNGGTLTAGGYQFAANQGLHAAGVVPATVYTVDVVFAFDTLTSWHKILDYKDLSTDEGFYTYGDALQFVIVAGSQFATSSPQWVVGVPRQATITRDATGHVVGYIDRVEQWSFDDTADVATFTGPAHFFIDDNATGMGEATGGVVRRIRIYDTALTASQIPP